jgi:hypothetical protein
MGAWLTHAVPWLVRPIARGLVGNIRLIVALQENERDVRFSPRYFDEDQIEDIAIKLFPWADFVELVSQRLRALDYTRESFDGLVNDVFDKGIKSRDYWDTQYFELLDMHARVNGWEQE